MPASPQGTAGSRLVLVLGDQLSCARGALREADPARDTVLMAEVAEESGYVPHNRHKLVFIFSWSNLICKFSCSKSRLFIF